MMNKILAAISICMFLYLCLKNDGLIDYYKEFQHHKKLVNQKNILVNELDQIKAENELLKNNKRYIEKIVREEYFYIYPDEIIISVD